MRREHDAILSLQRFLAGVLPAPWDVRLTLEAGLTPVRPYALIEQVGSATSDGSQHLQDMAIAYTANLYLAPPGDKSRDTADAAALDLREMVWKAIKVGASARRPTTDLIPLYSYEPRDEVQRVRVRGATAGTWRLRQAAVGAAPAGPWTPTIAFGAAAAGVQAALDVPLPGSTLVVPRGIGVFDIHFTGNLAGTDVGLLELDLSQLVGAVTPSVKVVLHGAPAPWRSASDYMRVTSFGQTTIRDPEDPTLVQVAVDLRCAFARGLPLAFDTMLLQRISATVGNGG